MHKSPFYTRVEAKQDIELHITLEPFQTQTRQVEATVVTAKLCRQQLSERNSTVAEIRVWRCKIQCHSTLILYRMYTVLLKTWYTPLVKTQSVTMLKLLPVSVVLVVLQLQNKILYENSGSDHVEVFKMNKSTSTLFEEKIIVLMPKVLHGSSVLRCM